MNNSEFQHINHSDQIENNPGAQREFPDNPYYLVGANQNFNRFSATKPQRTYSDSDRFFAIAALVLGFVTIKVVTNTISSGGGFLTTVLFLGITLFNYFYCKKSGMSGSGETKVIFAVTLVLSSLFVITDNYYIKTIDFWLVTFSNLYFVYSSYRSNNNSIIHNLFKAVLLSPFYEFSGLFEALFRKCEDTDKNKTIKFKSSIIPIALGLAFSVPVCIAVMSLLSSSDKNFGRMFGILITKYFDRFVDDFFSNLFLFIFSFPIGMYIFGAVYSRAYKMKHENELVRVPEKSKRNLPSSACNAFLTPLILIYIAFVMTQISYMFNTFGKLSEDFSYSEYARSGFFELCFVAIINLSVIAAVMFFKKLKDRRLPLSVKVFIIMFSVLTLCLIVTALVKMMMYIGMYGMTPLRVYTSVFMIYLFILFIVLIFKQFRFSISFTKIAYCLAVVIIAAMALLPVDGFIASYNIEKYKQGEISWMGYDAMEELDSSAVKVFASCDREALNERGDFKDYTFESYFRSKNDIGYMNIYDFNLTRYFALYWL